MGIRALASTPVDAVAITALFSLFFLLRHFLSYAKAPLLMVLELAKPILSARLVQTIGVGRRAPLAAICCKCSAPSPLPS